MPLPLQPRHHAIVCELVDLNTIFNLSSFGMASLSVLQRAPQQGNLYPAYSLTGKGHEQVSQFLNFNQIQYFLPVSTLGFSQPSLPFTFLAGSMLTTGDSGHPIFCKTPTFPGQ